MSYVFKENLVSSNKYSIKCPYTMKPRYIVCHNTANDASAENEVKYMISNNNQVSFHIACGDSSVVQGLPLNRNAWHAGDGNGNGNRKSIGVEICYSLSGGDRYYKAEDNAAIVVAQLMKQYNIPISKVRTHQSWSGKYCPHRMLAEGRWDSFIERVQNAYSGGGNSGRTQYRSGTVTGSGSYRGTAGSRGNSSQYQGSNNPTRNSGSFNQRNDNNSFRGSSSYGGGHSGGYSGGALSSGGSHGGGQGRR